MVAQRREEQNFYPSLFHWPLLRFSVPCRAEFSKSKTRGLQEDSRAKREGCFWLVLLLKPFPFLPNLRQGKMWSMPFSIRDNSTLKIGDEAGCGGSHL